MGQDLSHGRRRIRSGNTHGSDLGDFSEINVGKYTVRPMDSVWVMMRRSFPPFWPFLLGDSDMECVSPTGTLKKSLTLFWGKESHIISPCMNRNIKTLKHTFTKSTNINQVFFLHTAWQWGDKPSPFGNMKIRHVYL